MNYYPKILPFYMTYPMPLIWEEEDTVMRDLEYLQELYPRQAKKYRKRIEELLERFDSEGSVLYDEYPDRMTLYKMAQDIYAVLEQEEKREQAEAAAVACGRWRSEHDRRSYICRRCDEHCGQNSGDCAAAWP